MIAYDNYNKKYRETVDVKGKGFNIGNQNDKKKIIKRKQKVSIITSFVSCQSKKEGPSLR